MAWHDPFLDQLASLFFLGGGAVLFMYDFQILYMDIKLGRGYLSAN